MKFIIKITICMVILFISISDRFNALAQNEPLEPLKIGDKVPDVLISNIVNYKTKTVHIADFKGKLLILDFWGVTCESCIEEMPRMEKLQTQFGDKIQILLVTADSKDKVDKLFKKLPSIKALGLPSAVGETELTKLFPYSGYGLQVWIDGKGAVSQKTEGSTYDADDIQNYLNGEQVILTERKDAYAGHHTQLKDFNIYHSYISERNPGEVTGFNFGYDNTTHKLVRSSFQNVPLLSLFGNAYSDKQYDEIVYEVNDSSKYFRPKSEKDIYAWELKNTYCYEIQVPPEKSDRLHLMMQQDLGRYFDLTGKIERRPVKYLALTKTSQFEELQDAEKNKTSYQGFHYDKNAYQQDSIVSGKNFSLVELINLLNLKRGMVNYYDPNNIKIVNETGYTQSISIKMRIAPDVKDLRKELQKNGLDLKEAEREFYCLILTEKGYKGGRVYLH